MITEKLANKYSLPVDIDDRFREVGFGSWEGRSRAEIKHTNRREYDDFYRDPINCRPAGAEPIDDFILRVSSAYEDVLQNFSGQHCLIVAHAGVIRAVVAHVVQATPLALYRIQVSNAGISRIRHGRYGGMLEFHNR